MVIIRDMKKTDCTSVMDILNYYVEHSFAAFPEEKIPYKFFDEVFLKFEGYPKVVIENKDGIVIGFAMLRPHSHIPTFRYTSEITYFIKQDMTGQGLGTLMLTFLLDQAKAIGIQNILAGISSLNDGSICFHNRHGFKECGRFHRIGLKKDVNFDVVWMQLEI